MSVIPMDDKLPNTIVNMADKMYYSEADKPVFFGHYWLYWRAIYLLREYLLPGF
jgi:hypothetical protein